MRKPNPPKPSALTWVRGFIRLALFPVAFLWPAGTWRWWEAWVVIGLFVGYAVAIGVYLHRHDPALLRERMNANPAQEGQKGWDKVLMVLMMTAGFGLFIVPGLDVVRFGWTTGLPVWLEVGAMALLLPWFWALGRVMRENTYLSRVVKIDKDRGHQVITTGPYAVVRHPMYAAVIPMILVMPLALGSLWALVPAAVMAALLVVRTALEDATLHDELDGYPQYAATTRFRLIPGIW